jgi:hypothetical protein
MRPTDHIAAHRDLEASVWYSETNIAGLAIAAATVAELEELISELAPVEGLCV